MGAFRPKDGSVDQSDIPMTFNKTYGLRETDKRLDRLLRKNARGKLHQVNNGGRSDIPGFLARIARKHCDVSFPAFRAIVIVWD